MEFQDVSFRYPGSSTWALRHVNIKFRIGRRMAVVGENRHAGKTTFIKLLCRLYDPQEGHILLNASTSANTTTATTWACSRWCSRTSAPGPASGENVAGARNYDRDRAQKALVDAGLGTAWPPCPRAWTPCCTKEFAEDGVDVSGGEAQKIAIARALYKDAPFIILDEPTPP